LSKNTKEKNSDSKYWKEFINNPKEIYDKDKVLNKDQNSSRKFKFDFHGFKIDDANKKVEQLINTCHAKGFGEILIITGKGIHSNNENDVYSSKEHNKLQNTLPEFIKNNPDLISKITSIKLAPAKLGGSGAFVIKLKKL
jgi:DNA-nicking Smr family endonuclease|tara:strand:- start:4 stop:423 length:420 start_codon:yes stop_codon:yes gene_type:complete